MNTRLLKSWVREILFSIVLVLYGWVIARHIDSFIKGLALAILGGGLIGLIEAGLFSWSKSGKKK